MISSFDGTNTLYYHDSNLGNVNQITNNSGTVIQTYDYDAFGNITNQTGSLTTKYAYKTKEYSPETGLIFFGARYYNPLIGRFITKDPSGMVDGPNQYIYLSNDPVNKMDPWGLFDLWVSGQDPGPTGEIYGGGGSGGCIGWGDVLDIISNILIVGDIVAGGPTGEGIGPAAAIQAGKKAAKDALKKGTKEVIKETYKDRGNIKQIYKWFKEPITNKTQIFIHELWNKVKGGWELFHRDIKGPPGWPK